VSGWDRGARRRCRVGGRPLSTAATAYPERVVGVLGGTFDPIHYGHLRPAAEAAALLGLTEVRVVPAAAAPLRGAALATAAQRLRMAELAVAEFSGFRVDDREIRRGGPSYTVDTLESLRAELGPVPLVLLMGMDQFLKLEQWHRWRELLRLAHVAVLTRPGYPQPSLPAWAGANYRADTAPLRQAAAGLLGFVPASMQDVSATEIRRRRAAGQSIAGLTPPAVQAYIEEHGLYGRSPRGS